ncbi:hypothetical protein OMR58_16195 [Erwinia sp. INIA-01]|uniref:hypothetical protein n=1 Tax=Erwinia sp. INIA01 TaxID=2991500 RepID=UPI0022247D40|nr:hypothetical protein [Erwinia sp. INIA01]MCW1875994.1 hypothetical protein [Erwinia sp. INIA01]
MKNILNFPRNTSTLSRITAEAVPNGVLMGNRVIGYAAVVRQLDKGQFDAPVSDGFGIIAELSLAEEMGWFIPTVEQRVIVWRWIVAGVFIVEQMKEHGLSDVPQGDGRTVKAAMYVGPQGAISIYPAAERFALANHAEQVIFEEFTHDEPLLKVVVMYQSMVEPSPHGGLTLSAAGREGLYILHDGFIELLQTEGMPATPTAH